MGTYRKKPVTVEAWMLGGDEPKPKWFESALDAGTIRPVAGSPLNLGCVISTLEGDMVASPGDYIIKGVNGELYPCKPDIFEKTYDQVDAPREVEYVDYCDI